MDSGGLDDKSFRKLEYYSLVSKVCTELNNHLGLEDKVLGNAELVLGLEIYKLIH